jgi:hypothetical protein
MIDLIATIKAKLGPLPKFIASELGQVVKHKKNGHFVTDCPFCASRNTLWINDNVCNCFKPHCAARVHMDLINFYARLYEIDNGEAIKLLASKLPPGAISDPQPGPAKFANLANVDLWDLPDWLESRGLEVAGVMEWRPDPAAPGKLKAYLPVREATKCN